MTLDEFTMLVERAGLNLLSAHPPRFLVSLHVETQFGERVQCGGLLFETVDAFSVATTEETITGIEELSKRLSRASQTRQGDVARGGTVMVVTRQGNGRQAAINYPAH